MNQRSKFLLAIVSSAVLAACGGGGDSSGSTPAPTPTPPPTTVEYTVDGVAVKGPLVNADIKLYRLDTTSAYLKGEMLAQGTTDSAARLQDISISDDVLTDSYYLLESSTNDNTVDLNTGAAPAMQMMKSVISKAQIESGVGINITPLTSLITDLALNTMETSGSFDTALINAREIVSSEVGRETLSGIDPFTSPLLVEATSASAEAVLRHRISVEGLIATVGEVINGSDASIDEFLAALAIDLKDGSIDTDDYDKVIPFFQENPTFISRFEQAMVAAAEIQGSDKDGDPDTDDPYTIAETGQLLADEQSDLGTDYTTTMFTDGSLSVYVSPYSDDFDQDGMPDLSDNDDDNDGVIDALDAFPRDASETLDSDNDGVGNNADAYPNDRGCSVASQGNDEGCYVTLMEADGNQLITTVHMGGYRVGFCIDTDGDNNIEQVYIQNAQTQNFETSIVGLEASSLIYSETAGRIYFSEADQLKYVDDQGQQQFLGQASGNIWSLMTFNGVVFAHHEGGYRGNASLFDLQGRVTAERELRYFSSTRAWNPEKSRIYHFRDGISPNDILYLEVSPESGEFGNQNDSPHHGDYSIRGPIIVSADGNLMLTGAGDLYDAETLSWSASLGRSFNFGYWTDDNQIVTINNSSDGSSLVRSDVTGTVYERLTNAGSILDFYQNGDKGIIVSRTENGLETSIYEPDNDTDNDGVENITDAFPLDQAASVDTDGDGYPDEWNSGATAGDSTTGLTLDTFPLDSACWAPSHSLDGACDYGATMPQFEPDQIIYTADGTVLLYNRVNGMVYRWHPQTQSYGNPIDVSDSQGFGSESPNLVAYSEAHNRLYLGYPSSKIKFIDLETNDGPVQFANVAMSVNGLAAVGNYVLAQDSAGAWVTHYILNEAGALTDSEDWNYFSRTYAWNATNSRVYFLRDDTSPNDLHFEEIDQQNGTITAEGDSPYHSSQGIRHPIRVSEDGQLVILGSGRVFHADSLEEAADLGRQATDILSIGGTIAFLEQGSLSLYATDGFAQLEIFTVAGSPVGLTAYNGDLIVITLVDGEFAFNLFEIGDSDQDGIPGWWENQYGMNDNDASDAATDDDSDELTALEEFSLGTNPNLADSDEDGLSDSQEVNNFMTNPLVADTDGDLVSDGAEVNEYGTDPNSTDSDEDGLTDGEEIYTHDSNPLATDSDSDGLPDLWEVENQLQLTVDDAQADADSDGLVNADEFANNTNPQVSDSDSDGLSDGDEVHIHLSNPLAKDTDGDRMRDDYEVANNFDVLSPSDGMLDADEDGYSNMEEYFLDSDPHDLSSVPVIGDWNTYQGNSGHTGFLPLTIDVSNLSERWRAQFNTEGTQVVSQEESAYLADVLGKHEIVKVNMGNGQADWRYEYSRSASITPLIDDQLLFVPENGTLRALNADAGSLRYLINTNSGYGIKGINRAGNYTIFPGDSTSAVDDNGELVWTTSQQSDSDLAVIYQDQIIHVEDDLVLLDVATGQINQQTELLLDNSSAGYRRPMLGSFANIFIRTNSHLFNVDIGSGEVIWQIETSNSNYQSSMANGFGRVYLVADSILKVYDELSGQLLWSWEAPNGRPITNNIVIARELVFVSTYSNTYAISLDTQQAVWSIDVAGTLSLQAAGTLYIAAGNELVAIDFGFDDDNDGLPNWWELAYGLDKDDPANIANDDDADGLTHEQEFANETNPIVADTDFDGLSDGAEVNLYGSDPLLQDTDEDGLTDGDEVNTYSTDLLDADSDDDGFLDGKEVNQYNTDPNDANSLPDAITSLSETFSADGLPAGWETPDSSNSGWAVDDTDGNGDTRSLRSGVITHGQTSSVEYSALLASGTFTFDAKVDSEACCDKLEVYVDDERVIQTVNAEWQSFEINLTSGEHVIRFSYRKDGSVDRGADSAWIDNISFTTN